MCNMRTLVIMSLLVFSPLLSFAKLKYVQSKDGNIVEVSDSSVEATCGKNFVFREKSKDDALPYLAKEIVKAAFKGEMSPSLDTVKATLRASNGKCAWLSEGETI